MRKLLFLFMFALVFACQNNAMAVIYHGVDFPGGAASFVDAVVSFDPVIKSGQPISSVLIPQEALGIPDYEEGPDGDYVTLGDGGSITLQFIDNSLNGSGSTALDLWVFEIGPDVEDTFVEISKDNNTWYSVGKVFGSTSGIDIDAYGFHQNDYFSYIRLTDDPNEGDQSGSTVGADIDAVGAITSAAPVNPNVVPEPASIMLLGCGVAGIFLRKKISSAA